MTHTTKHPALALVAALVFAACDTTTAEPKPLPFDPKPADVMRQRVIALSYSALVAVESLPPTTPGLSRVTVEVRALVKAADSLSVLTARDAYLCSLTR